MIRDLLNPALGYLELREDSKGVIQVAGITEVSTINAKEVSLQQLARDCGQDHQSEGRKPGSLWRRGWQGESHHLSCPNILTLVSRQATQFLYLHRDLSRENCPGLLAHPGKLIG